MSARIERLIGRVSSVAEMHDGWSVAIVSDHVPVTVALSAPVDIAMRAIQLIGCNVRATAVFADASARLIRIDAAGSDVAGAPDARLNYLTKRWEGTLAALARR